MPSEQEMIDYYEESNAIVVDMAMRLDQVHVTLQHLYFAKYDLERQAEQVLEVINHMESKLVDLDLPLSPEEFILHTHPENVAYRTVKYEASDLFESAEAQ